MYSKLLKLTNGDNLIVSTEDNCLDLHEKKYITITDPVEITSMRFPHGNMVVETFVMSKWIKMATDSAMQIPVASILIAVDVIEKADTQYKEFLLEYVKRDNELENADIEVPDTGVELEKFYKMLTNSEEEEDDSRPSSGTQTVH